MKTNCASMKCFVLVWGLQCRKESKMGIGKLSREKNKNKKRLRWSLLEVEPVTGGETEYTHGVCEFIYMCVFICWGLMELQCLYKAHNSGSLDHKRTCSDQTWNCLHEFFVFSIHFSTKK